jgi:hypothetical protein
VCVCVSECARGTLPLPAALEALEKGERAGATEVRQLGVYGDGGDDGCGDGGVW